MVVTRCSLQTSGRSIVVLLTNSSYGDRTGLRYRRTTSVGRAATQHATRDTVRLGVVVSVVGRINEVNEHRARLVHDG